VNLSPWGAPGKAGCRRWGTRSGRQALTLGLTLTVAVLAGRPLQAQMIQGRVLSSEGRTPIPQATVSLVDSLGNVLRTEVTTGAGVFRIPVADEVSSAHLQAQALGFFTFFDGPVDLTGAGPVEVEIRLQPRPFDMDSLSVTVERQSLWLESTGFYARRAMGSGFHMDRTAIQERPWDQTLADLFRAVPGASVDNEGRVRLRGMATLGGCPYNVFLDGSLVVSRVAPDPWWATSLIRPEDVDGIEVYRRPVEVPVQYSGAGGCGVILIWSRR
jgi:hypothetical protein